MASLYWVKPWLRETENKISLAAGRAGQLWLPGRGRVIVGVELPWWKMSGFSLPRFSRQEGQDLGSSTCEPSALGTVKVKK